MAISSFARLVWVYDGLATLAGQGESVQIFRSTDIQNGMYISGQNARRLMQDWHEDGYLSREFTGTEYQPRYDYQFTRKAIDKIQALTADQYWYHVAQVKNDAQERKAGSPDNRGSSILRTARKHPNQMTLL